MLHSIAYRLSLLINFIFAMSIAYVLGAFTWSKIVDNAEDEIKHNPNMPDPI